MLRSGFTDCKVSCAPRKNPWSCHILVKYWHLEFNHRGLQPEGKGFRELFDATNPQGEVNRQAIQELMTLSFMLDASNVMLVGPNGVGKSMLACNLGHQALIQGHTVLFITAGQLLGELAALDSDSALRRRLKHYAAPDLLLIDEVGYLSYSNRHADLLFELISRRYEQKSTVITTNRAFKEWHEVFPNAACVVSLIDRLVHRCEIVAIEGESYRLKEAKARSEKKAATRASAPGRGKK